LPKTDDLDRSFELALDLGENQKDPAEFRDLIILADKLGFPVAWLGDHFMPWFHSGNRSSFVWSLIASALEASRNIKVGPYVTTPIGARYHPLLVAQASATLDNMYPDRFLLSVGTGEAINELPFLEEWPAWTERMDRMIEGVQLMRKAWESESYFDFNGRYFKAKQIYLYTKPKTRKLEVYFSAVGPKAANLAGEHADGLITLSSRNSLRRLRDVILPSFEAGARRARKDPSKMKKIISLSFTLEDQATYLQKRRKSAGHLAKGALDEPDPRKIEELGLELSDEQIIKSTNFCSTWSDALEIISKIRELGFSQVVLESGPDAEQIGAFSEKILPYFARR
jgi:coenzyme F420-dependent glucose-6-phosphate dehydrogenase